MTSGMKNTLSEDAILEWSVNWGINQAAKYNCVKISYWYVNFWDKIKYRWASAFKFNLHKITRFSLAEAAQASMKAADEINVSLVDAVYYGITDSARLQVKWEIRISAERCTGCDPSNLELSERSSRRQTGRAHRFFDEEKEIFATTEELPALTLSLSQSSQPPKGKKKDWDQLIHKAFEKFKKKRRN